MNCQNMFETFNLPLDIYYLRLASGNLQPLVKRLLPLATIVRRNFSEVGVIKIVIRALCLSGVKYRGANRTGGSNLFLLFQELVT